MACHKQTLRPTNESELQQRLTVTKKLNQERVTVKNAPIKNL